MDPEIEVTGGAMKQLIAIAAGVFAMTASAADAQTRPAV